jgi:ketosteroid isomerase-like protein
MVAQTSKAGISMADSMAVVDKMYECFGRGDIATLKHEVFADDIAWTVPGHNPLSGTKHGVNEVVAFFGALIATGVNVDNVSFGTIGDDKVVELHTGHANANGRDYIFPTCTIYTIRDGRIASVQVYSADQNAVDDYFWHANPLKAIPERLASRLLDEADQNVVSLLAAEFPWITSEACNEAAAVVSAHLDGIDRRRPIDIDELRQTASLLHQIVGISASV